VSPPTHPQAATTATAFTAFAGGEGFRFGSGAADVRPGFGNQERLARPTLAYIGAGRVQHVQAQCRPADVLVREMAAPAAVEAIEQRAQVGDGGLDPVAVLDTLFGGHLPFPCVDRRPMRD